MDPEASLEQVMWLVLGSCVGHVLWLYKMPGRQVLADADRYKK